MAISGKEDSPIARMQIIMGNPGLFAQIYQQGLNQPTGTIMQPLTLDHLRQGVQRLQGPSYTGIYIDEQIDMRPVGKMITPTEAIELLDSMGIKL